AATITNNRFMQNLPWVIMANALSSTRQIRITNMTSATMARQTRKLLSSPGRNQTCPEEDRLVESNSQKRCLRLLTQC
ncbi:MAG: hypothetical protein WBS14_03610, partial [Rhodomicrobium sp.]